MSLYPCDGCATRVPGKLSQVYWAWNRADGTRAAVKSRLCLTCFGPNVLYHATAAMESVVACPLCHAGTVEDMDPVYATIYIPGQDRWDSEWATCGPCAANVRTWALDHSAPLPDRQAGDGGPAPQRPSAADVWRDLGYVPR